VQIHPPDALDTLPHSVCIGPIDPTTVPRAVSEPTAEEDRIATARAALPHPQSALNLAEIEVRTTPEAKRLFRGVIRFM
jgi:L-lactate dehydrogenase (cytochrome)